MTFTPEEARQRKNARQKEYSKRTNYALQKAYNKERGKAITFRLFRPQDNDLIEWVDKQPNKAGYFKKLIRDDMERRS